MTYQKSEVRSEKLNTPLGVFSQATRVDTSDGTILYISGLTSRAPDGSVVGADDVALQTRTILENMQAILAEVNGTLADVVKVTVFIRDMEDFKEIHAVRSQFFKQPLPASTMVEVSRLVSPEHLIEIEAVAYIAH